MSTYFLGGHLSAASAPSCGLNRTLTLQRSSTRLEKASMLRRPLSRWFPSFDIFMGCDARLFCAYVTGCAGLPGCSAEFLFST